MRKTRRRAFLIVVLCLLSGSILQAQPLPSPDATEIQLTLKRLTVLGSVLYVGAHPDDENTAFLAYCSRGRLVRAAYLSATRGEGGQNLIGPEQGDLLGVIRTQELLAARRVDGSEQFFTSAVDFGYSKDTQEALRIWNKRQILGDMVWIIRSFRPDVIVTRFTPTLGTHGHHTASALLAGEAFAAAGDPLEFPEQLSRVQAWKPKRIMFNYSPFFGVPFDTASAMKIDLGEYQPLLGRSFTEISGIGRSMHKSQGFGASQNRGPNVSYFMYTAGDSARKDLFDGVDLRWSRVPGGAAVGSLLEQAASTFHPENPAEVLPLLLKAYTEMSRLLTDPWVSVKRKELAEAIRECSGIWVDALSVDPAVMPGSSVVVNVSALNRSHVTVRLTGVRTTAPSDTALQISLGYNTTVTVPIRCAVPAQAPITQPYWLQERPESGHYHLPDRTSLMHAENPPAISADLSLDIMGTAVMITVPVQYRWVDPVEGELYRALAVVPPVTVSLGERNYVFASDAVQQVAITVKNGPAPSTGSVSLRLPEGWKAVPASLPFTLIEPGQEQTATISITPGTGVSGEISAVAQVADGSYDRAMTVVRYPHIPAQMVFPRAEGKLLRIDLTHRAKRIGYVMGSGDAIPPALRQIGYDVTLLSDDDLAGTRLAAYDAIIAGVRAYNTRPRLRLHQDRLLEYVKNGGTYIVQYVTVKPGESDNIGPFSLGISRDRVSNEDAPVTMLDPGDPLLTRPNAITSADFEGWVQERGLSFADKWDAHFRPVLACSDSGEPSRQGGLLVASYGNGSFVYTGLSFFRQLPEGVPGAYRLFVNLIEHARRKGL